MTAGASTAGAKRRRTAAGVLYWAQKAAPPRPAASHLRGRKREARVAWCGGAVARCSGGCPEDRRERKWFSGRVGHDAMVGRGAAAAPRPAAPLQRVATARPPQQPQCSTAATAATSRRAGTRSPCSGTPTASAPSALGGFSGYAGT